MIKLNKITISFDNEIVLKNISFHLKEGERLILIGRSGSGKSLLLKMISGLLEPDSGNIFINGKNLFSANYKEKNLLQQKMGMLFQKNALFDSLTVGENIGFPIRETTKTSETEIIKKIKSALKNVGLINEINNYPENISGGMKKRLGLARALALNPKIILYDDPTAGLDPLTSREIIDLILKFQRKNNSTMVAALSDINSFLSNTDKIGFIHDTKLIIYNNFDEIKNDSHGYIKKFFKTEKKISDLPH